MAALMKGEYNSESVGMESLKMEIFVGAKGAQSCTGLLMEPSTAAPYIATNGNSRTFARLPSPVQWLH